jgi:dTDP-glucose pyrophosphorylase
MITDWQKTAVPPNATMKMVMQVIDKGALQIALVVEDGCRLLGTVTDGDIRRAILRGEPLDAPVQSFMNANPITGLIDEDAHFWQRTMQRYKRYHLPILDANGCVIGLARYETPDEPQRDNLVVLMAGGQGTRLRPLTETVPKPLLTIGSKPILETIIENFIDHGFHHFALCINYKGELIRSFFKDGSQWDVDISYVEENEPLGTAGALGLLEEIPEQPFFVMNGDVLTKVDFVRLLEFHKKQGFTATMCVREYHHQIPYGVVELDGHKLSGLKEKPIQHYYVNAGIYVLDPSVLACIPSHQYLDMPRLFGMLMEKNEPVGTFPLREYWIDIGQKDQFEQAHNDYHENFSLEGEYDE